MDFKKGRVALLVTLLLAGCGSMGLPNGTVSMTQADAERMYAVLDSDPTVQAVTSMLARLGVKVDLSAVATATATTTDTTTADASVTVPSNAQVVTGVDQAAPVTTTECQVTHVTASSTLDDRWFARANCTDGNTHSAWAPAANDADPTLTFDFAGACRLQGLSLKLSPAGVVVDVETSADGQTRTAVATGLVPVYRQLHWVNLPERVCSHVRLHFRGVQDGHLLVCEAHPNGMGEAASASPAPVGSPTATPVPSVMPTTTPSASPAATPSVTPTAEATATPTPAPTATPTAEPTATPTPEATATPTAAPTATPTPAATATPTPAAS